jgi:hypothetical protein
LGISFAAAGGRYWLPYLEQNIPFGIVLLLGVIFLIILSFGKASRPILKWTASGIALGLLSMSLYYLVTIWKIYLSAKIIGQTPPGIGLYIFFLGSLLLFLGSVLR